MFTREGPSIPARGIARDHLGAAATETEVFHEGQRLWRVNGALIGTGDPDLILGGRRIRPP